MLSGRKCYLLTPSRRQTFLARQTMEEASGETTSSIQLTPRNPTLTQMSRSGPSQNNAEANPMGLTANRGTPRYAKRPALTTCSVYRKVLLYANSSNVRPVSSASALSHCGEG